MLLDMLYEYNEIKQINGFRMSPEKMDLEWLKQKDKNLTKMTIPCSCSCTAFTLWFLKLQHQITVKCST